MKNSNLKQIDNYLERLYGITNTIRDLYLDLTKSKDKEKTLEYLALAIEVENKIYKEIGQKLLSSNQFIRRAQYKIRHTDYKDDAKNDIVNRIINYITQLEYINPFTSQEPYYDDYQKENLAIIKNQAILDYAYLRIFYYDILLEETKSKRAQKIITKQRNKIIFTNKILDNFVNKPIELPKTLGREKCEIFNHDKDEIEYIYSNAVADIINPVINILLNYTNTLLSDPQVLTYFNMQLIDLKCGLDMATPQEVISVSQGYKSLIENNELLDDIKDELTEVDAMITKTITDALMDKNEVLQKEKNNLYLITKK